MAAPMVVCCLLLNQTTRKQLDPVLFQFFKAFPTPQALLDCGENPSVIRTIIAPLGLQEKRTQTLLRFTHEFLHKDWQSLKDLHGVGEYANEAHNIFCLGVTHSGLIEDHALNWYVDWKLSEGQ